MGFSITANLVRIVEQSICPATVTVEDGRIQSITLLEQKEDPTLPYLLPGFVDSHVHVESSLLIPSEFARLAVVHGTVGTISDPHEIANVCGMDGVLYMIENGNQVPFKFHFGAPSCVPATTFETAGATLDVADVTTLLQRDDIYYLSEMMNFPGVLFRDPDVLAKIAAAQAVGKPVDGHAPGLRGEQAETYIRAGISTDHECFTEEEALDKLQRGMKILIREGSAAKNFDALHTLLHQHHEQMMFCSDDKHPDSLLEGHINQLCARAVAAGIDVFQVLYAACIHPVKHYCMRIGLLQVGDPADMILVNNLQDFQVRATYIDGQLVAEHGQTKIERVASTTINQFRATPITPRDLHVPATAASSIPVMEALDGQLITNRIDWKPVLQGDAIVSSIADDVLKLVVINRYQSAPPAISFIRNFGLKQGAIASTVAHDSHNIIAVGVDDASLTEAINAVIQAEGGLSVQYTMNGVSQTDVLALPVAGLMSNEDGYAVAERYTRLDHTVKSVLGSPLRAPFMTLSFMALLVIPYLKLSDKGLFDGNSFTFVDHPLG